MTKLAACAADLRYLLDRDYPIRSALKLVGDHAQLHARERQLLFRCVAPTAVALAIRATCLRAQDLRGRALLIDGYNVIITLETALAGGPIVRGDDGFSRDLAGSFGSHRTSARTDAAIALLRSALDDLGPAPVEIYLDRPVPFSARLADRLRTELRAVVHLENSADGALKRRIAEIDGAVVATADTAILREARASIDLVAVILDRALPEAWIVRL